MFRLFGYFSFALFLLITSLSCDSSEPLANNGAKLTLAVEDSSSTEVWLRLTSSNIPLPISISLSQNNSVTKTIDLCCDDTLLYIDSLLPKQTYKFKAEAANYQQPTSNEVTATTMDTTSHNFIWQSFTFGDAGAGSSTLYDVAIINENDIWAVGEIYMLDSLGNPDPKRYNAIKWNGSNWATLRIPYNYQGTDFINPIQSVFVFAANDIWFCGNGVIHWDGNNYVPVAIPTDVWGPYQMNKIWGTSSSDLYVVGNGGSIAHYSGPKGGWQKIESGTDVDLKDIYGTQDGKTVWVSGYEEFKPTVLLKISDPIINTVFISRDYLFIFDPDHISGGISGVWTNNSNFIYLTTWYSLYRKSIYTDSSQAEALKPSNSTTFFGLKSKGTEINNIFTIGSRNNIHHYNGTTFITYKEPADDNVTYYSLDVKSKLSVLCGQKFENGISDKAIITLIK